MKRSLAVRVWCVTLGLALSAAAGVWLVVRTGGPPSFAAVGVGAVGYVSAVSWRSGGRFEFTSRNSRKLGPRDNPEIRRALLEVCERAGRPLPAVVLVTMPVPAAEIGYDDGTPTIAVDPRLLWIVGPQGLRAIFAHELGHIGMDRHTDAIRTFVPQVLGFCAFWLVALAGRGPTVATAGSALYVGLALASGRWPARARYALSFGVEALALACCRYTNRIEEFWADAYAAELVSPATLTDALYHVAAVGTGDTPEDIVGPIPWEADRSLRFRLFATHPSIERRADALGCDLPAWVRPWEPHRS